VAVVAVACDETFDPIAPTDLAFSVFGYLDASADTQWIRIMPIRPLKVTSRDVLAAEVTLEHLETGRVIELRDSLFRFSSTSDLDLGSEGAYLHNFWTSEDIEPGAAYRFSARREGREPSEVVVEIPHDYEVEVAIRQVHSGGGTDELRITGVKHLPFLTAVTNFYDSCGSGVSKFGYRSRSDDDETHTIEITKQRLTGRHECGLSWVANRGIWIVGSKAEWPFGEYSQHAPGEAGRASNVTNAVGFLGGVLTRLIPYEDCYFQSGGTPAPDYCLLRYNQETATVSGTVSEPQCFGPLDSVVLQMTELGREPARIRTVLSNGAGEFLFGALEPGIPHLVWARAPPVPVDSVWNLPAWRWDYVEWEDIHTQHTDTLTFLPGQQVDYDIHLERLLPCNVGTLMGTVTEASCGDGPIDSATIQLTELGVPPLVTPRTLTSHTDSSGQFFITGLRQYVHLLQVRGPDPDSYTEHVDYLRFPPNLVVKKDIQLGRLTPCGEPPP
jgi:hypothetical protein